MEIYLNILIRTLRAISPAYAKLKWGQQYAAIERDVAKKCTSKLRRLYKCLAIALVVSLPSFSSQPALAAPPQLTEQELDVMGDLQAFTIAHLQQLRSQAKHYANCYRDINLCPEDTMDEFKLSQSSLPRILEIYRRWMGLVRIKEVLNYRRLIDSLIDGLPPLDLTRQEVQAIKEIDEKNQRQILQEWRELTPPPHHYLKQTDRYVDFATFKMNREVHIKALYLRQIGELLQDKPYILYIKGPNPRSQEMVEIFEQSVVQLDEEIARIRESQDARELLELTPIVRRYYLYLLETEQSQREARFLNIKNRFDAGEFDDGFFEANKWTLGFAACTVVGVAIAKSPNIATLACGTGGVIFGSVNLYTSVNRYLIARDDWLYGLRSIEDLDQPKVKAVQSVLLLMLAAQSAWLSNRRLFTAEALPHFKESMRISTPNLKANFANAVAFQTFAKTSAQRVSVSTMRRESGKAAASMATNPLVQKLTEKIRLPSINDFLTALVAEGKVANYQTMRKVGLIPEF